MKKIIFALLIAMMLGACATHREGRALPPPVFSNEPAVVRLMLKSRDTDSVSNRWFAFVRFHSILVSTSTMLNRSYASNIDNGVMTFDISAQPGMSCGAQLSYKIDSKKGEAKAVPVILVPGDTITCTIDRETNEVSYSGRFAQLCKELYEYRYNSNKYFPFIVDHQNNTFRFSNTLLIKDFEGLEEEEATKLILNRYSEAKKKVMRSKKLSPEFKELWRAYAAADALYIDEEYQVYCRAGKYGKNSASISLSACSTELMPEDNYSFFYINNTQDPTYVINTYKYAGYNLKVNPSIQRLMKATHYILNPWQLYEMDTLALMKEKLPEYYNHLYDRFKKHQKMNNEWRTMPPKKELCEVNRNLEGDEFVDTLLSRYKGKPTFLYIELNGPLHPHIDMRDQYSDIANFLCVTGGKYFSEDRMQESLRREDIDAYLLMSYQIEYLMKKFCSERTLKEMEKYNNHTSNCLLFDAEGRLVLEFESPEFKNKESDYMALTKLQDRISAAIGNNNFKLNGVVAQGINDRGYLMTFRKHIGQYKHYIDAPSRKFSYSTHIQKPITVNLTAVLPDSTLCTHSMEFLALPGEECNISVEKEKFHLSGSEFYQQWGNAERFVEKAREEHSSEEADAVIKEYASKHRNEPGCILFHVMQSVLPVDYIEEILPSEIKEGKFARILNKYGIY